MLEQQFIEKTAERDTFDLFELQDRTGIPYKTLWDAAKRGQFPTVRIGRKLLVPRHAYEMWLKGEWEPKLIKPARRK